MKKRSKVLLGQHTIVSSEKEFFAALDSESDESDEALWVYTEEPVYGNDCWGLGLSKPTVLPNKPHSVCLSSREISGFMHLNEAEFERKIIEEFEGINLKKEPVKLKIEINISRVK